MSGIATAGGVSRRQRSDGAQLHTENHAAANGYWKNVAICLGRKPPDEAAAADYRAVLEQIIGQHPDGVGVVTIIQSASTPTPDGRDAMVQMFRDLWPHLLCAAFVVEGKGFGAAAQRSVLAAFLMATRLGRRMKIFSSIETATAWMAGELNDGRGSLATQLLAGELNAVAQEFRDRYTEDQ